MTTRAAGRPTCVLAAGLAVLCLHEDALAAPRPLPAACAALAMTVPPARRAALARGINLTDWLKDGLPEASVLAGLKDRGLTHVRLPVPPERFLAAFGLPGSIAHDTGVLDRTIDGLLGLGFAVSLDVHPSGPFQRLEAEAPDAEATLLDELWQTLAARYAAHPADRLFLEVLNEPGFAPQEWRRVGPRLVATIRRAAPEHTIIYALTGFQRIDELAAPLPDPNVVYAVHFYDPMIFTHQGQAWSDDPLADLSGVPFPAARADATVRSLTARLDAAGKNAAADRVAEELRKPWTVGRIGAVMRSAGDWARAHGVPVIVNEFGVLAWKAPAGDRLTWLRAVATGAEANCLGWAVWDFAGGFGVVTRADGTHVPDEAALAALLD